jgi:hypothetical protein
LPELDIRDWTFVQFSDKEIKLSLATVRVEKGQKTMSQQTFLQRLESFGYYTLPRPHADSPGYGGLLAILHQAPQGHDLERIQLNLHEWNGKISRVNLHANLDQPLSHVLCPGRIVIRSHQEREATFYTFGGSLESESLPGETVFSMRSAAPVLELLPESETRADLLAIETEALFARIEAQQQLSSEQLWDRLAKAGPEAVYLAVVQSLLLDAEATAVSNYHRDFHKMITSERDWYQQAGRWPLNPRDLANLVQTVAEK